MHDSYCKAHSIHRQCLILSSLIFLLIILIFLVCSFFLSPLVANERHQSLTLRYNNDASSVLSTLQLLADQSGRPLKHLSKWPMPQTKSASVQGRWDIRFNEKTKDEQLQPLLQQQTHLIGLAPAIEPTKGAK